MVIGLTGSIATGKSTAARMIRHHGFAVFDADACVHTLMKCGGEAYPAIASAFTQTVQGGDINRRLLGERVFADTNARLTLEAILHPLVRRAEMAFIRRAIMRRCPLVFLDIPLLYETGADALCDQIWIVHCPEFLQHQRAMQRKGMSEQKLNAIIARQMPQAEKIRRADVAISSGIGKGAMMRQIKAEFTEVL